MSWTRLDDAMGEHRKIQRALRKSRPSLALHFLAILHCSRYLTDGFVEDEFIEEALTVPRERELALTVLVEQGLWAACAGGYVVHDYLEHNPSREKVLAQRAADAARKARGRQARSDTSPPGVQPESAGTDGGRPAESVRPVPSRPVPSIESEGADAPAPVDGALLGSVVAVLRTAPRLTFDPLLAGVANVIVAFPTVDHVQAAHIAVSNVADPTYRTTDAAKALRFAIADLERQKPPRGGGRAPAAATAKPKPWAGALRPLIDDTTEAA